MKIFWKDWICPRCKRKFVIRTDISTLQEFCDHCEDELMGEKK